MTERLIRITTAAAVVAVAVVAAVISYQHAFELVRSHGESGLTARLLPVKVVRGATRVALALVGSFELLMMLIRAGRGGHAGAPESQPRYQPAPPLAPEAPLELPAAPGLEQTVRARHDAGHSQRAIGARPRYVTAHTESRRLPLMPMSVHPVAGA